MHSISIRAWCYLVVFFLTPFSDKIVPLLYENKWPSGPVIVASAIVGLINAAIGLRAYLDGSAERAKNGKGNTEFITKP